MQVIVALAVGAILFLVGDFISVIGILVVAAGVWILYKTYNFNQEIGEYLTIELNSGSRLYFYEKNHQFTAGFKQVVF